MPFPDLQHTIPQGKPVSPHDISVVIQGPLHRGQAPARGISACIASVRKHLPGAEIIVSTWDYEDITELHGCRCICSPEPTAFTDIVGRVVNTNRQILSTRVGIEAAARPYVLKFRADHLLQGAALATIWEYKPDVHVANRLFRHPITLTNFFIRNPARLPMLFHLSDLVQFGLKEDMLDFWSQPLISREEHFLNGAPRRNTFGNFFGYTDLKVVPEQALMLGWLRRKGIHVALNYVCEVTGEKLQQWETLLAEHFRVLDWQQVEINFPPRFFRSAYPVSTVYTTTEITRIRQLGTWGKRLRYARVWFNQYVTGCFGRHWLLSTASILLFSLSPAWEKRLRNIWHKFRGSAR